MLHVRDSTMRYVRAYPTERKKPLPPELKEAIRVRLAELGQSHRWLEDRIGVSRGMVTKMLGPTQNTSALVDRVCAALDIEPPGAEVRSDDELELLAKYRALRQIDRARAAAIVETATAMARNADDDDKKSAKVLAN